MANDSEQCFFRSILSIASLCQRSALNIHLLVALKFSTQCSSQTFDSWEPVSDARFKSFLQGATFYTR